MLNSHACWNMLLICLRERHPDARLWARLWVYWAGRELLAALLGGR